MSNSWMTWPFNTNDVRNDYGTLNPEQVQLTKTLGPRLTSLLNQGSSAYQYSGQLTAPITSAETNTINNYGKATSVGANTLANLSNYDDQSFNDQFQKEIAQPTLQSWQNDIAPYLEQQYPTFSTARGAAMARNLQDVNSNLLQQRFTAREAAKNRAVQAATAAPAAGLQAAQLAGIPREIQQAGLDRQYNDFLQANQQSQQAINQMLEFLGVSTVTTTENPDMKILRLLIEGAKSSAQIAAAAA